MVRKIKIKIFRKLFFWWISYENGQGLRGTPEFEKVIREVIDLK